MLDQSGNAKVAPDGKEYKAFPFLPSQISINPTNLQLQMYCDRYDPRVQERDLHIRMQPGGQKLLSANAMNQRRRRFRNKWNIAPWVRQTEFPTQRECLFVEQLSWSSIQYNTSLDVFFLHVDALGADIPIYLVVPIIPGVTTTETYLPLGTFLANGQLHTPTERFMKVVEEIERLQAEAIEHGYAHWCLMPSRLKPSEWREKADSQNHLGGEADDVTIPAPPDIPAKALVWIKARIVDAAAGESSMNVPNVAELPRHSRRWVSACIRQGRAQALARGPTSTGSASVGPAGASTASSGLPRLSMSISNNAVGNPLPSSAAAAQPPPTYVATISPISAHATSTVPMSAPPAPMVAAASNFASAFPMQSAAAHLAPTNSTSTYRISASPERAHPASITPFDPENRSPSSYIDNVNLSGGRSHNPADKALDRVNSHLSPTYLSAEKRKRDPVDNSRKRIRLANEAAGRNDNLTAPGAVRVRPECRSSSQLPSATRRQMFRSVQADDENPSDMADNTNNLTSTDSKTRKRRMDSDDFVEDNPHKRLRSAPVNTQAFSQPTGTEFDVPFSGSPSTRLPTAINSPQPQRNQMHKKLQIKGSGVFGCQKGKQKQEHDSNKSNGEDSGERLNIRSSTREAFEAGTIIANGLTAGNFDGGNFDVEDLNAEGFSIGHFDTGDFDSRIFNARNLDIGNLTGGYPQGIGSSEAGFSGYDPYAGMSIAEPTSGKIFGKTVYQEGASGGPAYCDEAFHVLPSTQGVLDVCSEGTPHGGRSGGDWFHEQSLVLGSAMQQQALDDQTRLQYHNPIHFPSVQVGPHSSDHWAFDLSHSHCLGTQDVNPAYGFLTGTLNTYHDPVFPRQDGDIITSNQDGNMERAGFLVGEEEKSGYSGMSNVNGTADRGILEGGNADNTGSTLLFRGESMEALLQAELNAEELQQ